MRTMRYYFTLGLSLLLALATACKVSVTTANISSLNLGTDKSVSQPTTTFAPTDTIYAVAVISNAPSAIKVKGRLFIEEVEGQESGPIPSSERTVDLPGDGRATYSFSAPGGVWPAGKYKVEIFMLDSDGAQKDQKTASFTVSGGPPANQEGNDN